jgi:hypothetical protein
MTKSTITRKQALENALIFCNYANVTALTIEGNENIDWVETANILGKMLAQVSKPRAKAVSKARKANENLAERVMECFPFDGELQTTKDVVAMGFAEITTTQKAAAVLRVACEMGLAEKVTEGKKIAYRAASAENADVEGE